MASVTHGRFDHPSFNVFSRLQNGLARVRAHRAELKARRQVLRELRACDPRELLDLGISPYDFEAIARGTFRR